MIKNATSYLKENALKRLNKIRSNLLSCLSSYNCNINATKIQTALYIIIRNLYLSEKSIVSNFRIYIKIKAIFIKKISPIKCINSFALRLQCLANK